MNRLKQILVSGLAAGVVLAAVSSAGCVAEYTDGCPPEVDCRLSLSFTSDTGSGKLGDYIRSIEFYVFDASTGVLARTIEVGAEDIARGWIDIVDMPDGTYTFVAWGSSYGDMARSFVAVRMENAAEHRYGEIEVGHTTLDDFYMMLDHTTLPTGSEAQIAPARADFDDLFWSSAVDIGVVDRGRQIIPFVFIRNTNVLEIVVTGLEHLPAPATRADAPISIFATGSNGRYRWNNTIDEWARTVLYKRSAHTLTDETMGVDIKTMRLDTRRHTADNPMLLHLRDAAGDTIVPPLDILKMIMETRSAETGQLLYPDQAAIDRAYRFGIKVEIEPAPPVPVTGIELSLDDLTLEVDTQTDLTVIFTPADATDLRVVWTSIEPSVATVDQRGRVTALRPGVAIITATSVDGGHTASCTVTVVPNNPDTPDPDPGDDPGPDWEGTYGITVRITVVDWNSKDVTPII